MTFYSEILSTERLRQSSVAGRKLLEESESDRGRLLFCPAFRRLQQKAQVFSMESNAAVRSRLTHSLEVSQIGRYIADQICLQLHDRQMADPEQQVALANFVETACLMHDIGNPPFGHFGEAAIASWFDENGPKTLEKFATESDIAAVPAGAVDKMLKDFREFDGNPQGFRVVCRLQWNSDEYGLNLTLTSLASYLKYIRCAGEPSAGEFSKKAGFFSTERGIVEKIRLKFFNGNARRFPLAYIMEAADDIAYCVSDLEDSIEKGVVEQTVALKAIQAGFEQLADTSDSCYHEISRALEYAICGRSPEKEFTFTDFRTSVNRIVVGYVAGKYIENHDLVFSGKLKTLLPDHSAAGAILNALRNYCRKAVYGHESIQKTELAGYTAIHGLLDHYARLLRISRARFDHALAYDSKDEHGKAIIIERKLLKLFPERYKKVYQQQCKELVGNPEGIWLEWIARAHLVVDFVSGMTDDFAVATYRMLEGTDL